ncbi:MAG: hypothetical protein ACRD3W_08000 [Terriglobales bacterium]
MLKTFLPLCLCFLWATGGLAAGQTIHLPPSVRQGPTTGNIPVRTEEDIDRERAQKANAMLQEEIQRDTEKLFQLSTDLKEYVDKNQGMLSLDAVKKAEQIEKLAHGLKSKIKQSY